MKHYIFIVVAYTSVSFSAHKSNIACFAQRLAHRHMTSVEQATHKIRSYKARFSLSLEQAYELADQHFIVKAGTRFQKKTAFDDLVGDIEKSNFASPKDYKLRATQVLMLTALALQEHQQANPTYKPKKSPSQELATINAGSAALKTTPEYLPPYMRDHAKKPKP
jgi:hypothetical protein